MRCPRGAPRLAILCFGASGCADVLDLPDVRLLGRGEAIFGGVYGDEGDERGTGVAVDGEGSMFVAGTFSGELSLGSARVQSVGGRDMFVGRLDAAGRPQWLVSFGSKGDDATAADDELGALQVTHGSVLYVGGYADGPISVDGHAIDKGLFFARLDVNGTVAWAVNATRWPVGDAAGRGQVLGMGFSAGGEVLGCGSTTSAVFDSREPAGGTDAFLVRLTREDGAPLDAVTFGGAGDDAATAVAYTEEHAFYATGRHAGDLAPLASPVYGGGSDAFVLRYVPGDQQTTWVRAFGGLGDDAALGMALGEEQVVVAGMYGGAPELDGEALADAGPATNGFVVAFAQSTGATQAASTLGDGGADVVLTDVTPATSGTFAVAGHVAGELSAAGSMVGGLGGTDLVVLQLSPALAPSLLVGFGSAKDDRAARLVVTAEGFVILTGSLGGAADFGGGEVGGYGGDDLLLLKVGP